MKDQQLYVLTADGKKVPLPVSASVSEDNGDTYPEQSFQWNLLLRIWPAIAIPAGISAIFSAFISQTALAIINAVICIIGAFACFVVGACRYHLLLVFLLLFIFAAFLFEIFYAVALFSDFYKCDYSGCRGSGIYLYEFNYWFVVILTGVLLIVTRLSWTMLVDHRELTTHRLTQVAEKDKQM